MDDKNSLVAVEKAIWDCEVDEVTYSKLRAHLGTVDLERIYEAILFIRVVRSNMTLNRSVLLESVGNLIRGDGRGPLNGDFSPNLLDDFRTERLDFAEPDIDPAFRYAVKLSFALDVATIPFMAGGGPGLQMWDSTRSLADVIGQAFPKSSPLQSTSSSPFDKTKVAAKYLEDHAGVKIQWTSNLAEHMHLDHKTLYVFELPCLLEVGYNTTQSVMGVGTNLQTSKDVLSQGRYAPAFLTETLMTFRLLFPLLDREWLRSRIGSDRRGPRSQCDQRLLSDDILVEILRDDTRYNADLKDTKELVNLYPHWAQRLEALHREAADPTPANWWDEAAERRRDPRHAYKVAYLAFLLAIGFGVAATVLGAVQVWISYCQWKMPGGGHGCGAA